MSNRVSRIVVCGTSIFLSAIEVSLAGRTANEVVRAPPHLSSIIALEPNVVILERNDGDADLKLALLERGFPLIELDADPNRGALLTSRRVSISRVSELSQLINDITEVK
jgi:hypothetical protein